MKMLNISYSTTKAQSRKNDIIHTNSLNSALVDFVVFVCAELDQCQTAR